MRRFWCKLCLRADSQPKPKPRRPQQRPSKRPAKRRSVGKSDPLDSPSSSPVAWPMPTVRGAGGRGITLRTTRTICSSARRTAFRASVRAAPFVTRRTRRMKVNQEIPTLVQGGGRLYGRFLVRGSIQRRPLGAGPAGNLVRWRAARPGHQQDRQLIFGGVALTVFRPPSRACTLAPRARGPLTNRPRALTLRAARRRWT